MINLVECENCVNFLKSKDVKFVGECIGFEYKKLTWKGCECACNKYIEKEEKNGKSRTTE